MAELKIPERKKIAIVIGANSGIGITLLQLLLDEGHKVYGIDIQKEAKIETYENYTYFTADPLSLEAIVAVREKIKKQTQQLNGLVNLSGTIRQFKPITQLSFKDWNETYDISFKSCFNSCKVFASLLQQTKNSAIVNMSSGLAFIGQKNYGPYSAAKAAIVSFSKTLAAELAPNVRVNSVAPGAVDTDFIYKEDGSTRFNKTQYQKMVPLGSLAQPKEIATVIQFLLGNGASHMTGQCLHINGGAGMH